MAGQNAAPFVMHGARDVLSLAGTAVHLEQQIEAIEAAVIAAQSVAVDLARTMVETICKTILNDRGRDGVDALGFNDLLRNTYSAIQLVPDVKLATPESQEALLQLVENINSAISGISKLRMAEGIASHGKDAYFTPLESVQCEFAARAADAIVTFLYKAHRQYTGTRQSRVIEYNDHSDLNEHIDSLNEPARVFDLVYQPSEVLFHVDKKAYMDQLASFGSANNTDGEIGIDA